MAGRVTPCAPSFTHSGSGAHGVTRPASLLLCLTLFLAASTHAQTLLNVDFGVGRTSAKSGFAATGQTTNDFWNLYHHYAPKFTPGMPLVSDGRLDNLKLADGSDSKVSIAVMNAPGVWGNASDVGGSVRGIAPKQRQPKTRSS